MFKLYKFDWKDGMGGGATAEFYAHSRRTQNGFLHEACVIGILPRLDFKSESWADRRRNDGKIMKKRLAKVSYSNRTWELFSGQTVLKKLWNQLDELEFIDMSKIRPENPFKKEEPEHEDLIDPVELFDRFKW